MKPHLKTCLLMCLLPACAAAQGTYKVSVARMFDRTAADVSYKLFSTVTHDNDTHINIHVSCGLGVVRWDNDHNGEGRLHADVSFGMGTKFFSIGSFITSGANGDPALGIRCSYGWQSRNGLFVAGYWEYAQGLFLFLGRGGRAGIGVQAGFVF
ncbi:MAG: hypothetical protein LBC63_10230 [Holophagales bacterium]|nr:hypothetical protein [Holophagales bacterium]